MKIDRFIKKISKLRENPSYLKNYIYGMLKYFPVKKIHNKEMKSINIYCISLKNAKNRRDFMTKQVKKAGFENFEYYDAVDANKIDKNNLISRGIYDDFLSNKYHNRSLTNGEIACSLSHGRVYEIIVKKNIKMALILEDDALFVSDYINSIDLSILPNGWDIVFLSSFYLVKPPLGHIIKNLYTTESWNGSCAGYIVSENGAKKLADSYLPVIHAADGFVGRCMECDNKNEKSFKQKGVSTQIKTYLFYPDPIINGSTAGFWTTSLPAFINKS